MSINTIVECMSESNKLSICANYISMCSCLSDFSPGACIYYLFNQSSCYFPISKLQIIFVGLYKIPSHQTGLSLLPVNGISSVLEHNNGYPLVADLSPLCSTEAVPKPGCIRNYRLTQNLFNTVRKH